MDPTTTLIVCGLAALALAALVARDAFLLSAAAVAAGVTWTLTTTETPTAAWSLGGRLAAAVLLLDLGTRLRPGTGRVTRPRAALAIGVATTLVTVAVAARLGVLAATSITLLGVAAVAHRPPARSPLLVAVPLVAAGSLIPLTAALPSPAASLAVPVVDLLVLPAVAGVPAGLLLARVLPDRPLEDRGLLLGAALVIPVTLAAVAGATGVTTSLVIGATCAHAGRGDQLRRLLAPAHPLAAVAALAVLGAIATTAGSDPAAVALGVVTALAVGFRPAEATGLGGAVIGTAATLAAWLAAADRVDGAGRVAAAIAAAAVLAPLAARLTGGARPRVPADHRTAIPTA